MRNPKSLSFLLFSCVLYTLVWTISFSFFFFFYVLGRNENGDFQNTLASVDRALFVPSKSFFLVAHTAMISQQMLKRRNYTKKIFFFFLTFL